MILGVTKDVNPKSNSAPRNPVVSASLGRSARLAVPLALVFPLALAVPWAVPVADLKASAP